MNKQNINSIEIATQGQNENNSWFIYRKGVITASKAHDVLAKVRKYEKRAGGTIDMWSLNQKISGLTFVNPDIPALKYGRNMEHNAVNSFLEIFKKTHKNVIIQECGLFLHEDLPFIGASPDRIVSCSCCGQSCLEVKCPFSINYMSPKNANLQYIVKDGNHSKLKTSHKYYTQCQLQMAVTKLKESYFVVWTPHGMIIDEILFDEEAWKDMEEKLIFYYSNFYLKSLFPDS